MFGLAVLFILFSFLAFSGLLFEIAIFFRYSDRNLGWGKTGESLRGKIKIGISLVFGFIFLICAIYAFYLGFKM